MSMRDLASIHRVSKSTLGRLLAGGISLSEFNATKRHLTKTEERVLLDSLTLSAKRGFPLTHRLLKERANAILRVRKGPAFTVGKQWVSRFLQIHSKEISVYWSKPLDKSRANRLNPTAVGWFFDTLEELERGQNIPMENWYAADESGIMMGVAERAEVIEAAGQKTQHKLQDGTREIVTVLETICADGTVLRPTVVFKGKNLLSKWGDDNPCEASIGVGPKGYMDSELAIEYLMEFHEQTKGKNGLARVLMVDGHASHCSLAFLDLAVSLNIIVISYPPHTTHALQGLDVVVFGALKHHWQLVRDAREQGTGLPVKKEDFLSLYTPARTATMTPDIIKEAFRKTGAYPVNRNAISADQMVPSQDRSNQTVFPAELSSPVKAVLAAHHLALHPPPRPKHDSDSEDEELVTSLPSAIPPLLFPTADLAHYDATQRAKAMNFLLSKTSGSHLTRSEKPLTIGAPVPEAFAAQTIPQPIFEKPANDLRPDWSVMNSVNTPDVAHGRPKQLLINLLTEMGRAKAFSAVLESCLEASSAQLVLAHLEIARLRTSLVDVAAHGRKKNSRAKLMSSGEARMLTSNAFREAIRLDEEAALAKVAAKTARGKGRALGRLRKEWRADDIARRKELRAEQLLKWEEACAVAKVNKRRKPAMPKAPVRPKTPDDNFFVVEDEEGEEIPIDEVSDDEEDED